MSRQRRAHSAGSPGGRRGVRGVRVRLRRPRDDAEAGDALRAFGRRYRAPLTRGLARRGPRRARPRASARGRVVRARVRVPRPRRLRVQRARVAQALAEDQPDVRSRCGREERVDRASATTSRTPARSSTPSRRTLRRSRASRRCVERRRPSAHRDLRLPDADRPRPWLARAPHGARGAPPPARHRPRASSGPGALSRCRRCRPPTPRSRCGRFPGASEPCFVRGDDEDTDRPDHVVRRPGDDGLSALDHAAAAVRVVNERRATRRSRRGRRRTAGDVLAALEPRPPPYATEVEHVTPGDWTRQAIEPARGRS